MIISTQPTPSPAAPPAKGVSVTTLVFSLAVAVCATAAVVLAVVHFGRPAAAVVRGEGGGSTLAALLGDEPLVQKDTVSPQGSHTGVVYYPVRYATPPNLKFTATKRQYDIVKQDETSFTWMARPLLEDIREDKREGAEARMKLGIEFLSSMNDLKPNTQYEDFTWEAKGMRTSKDADALKPFEQSGKFNTLMGKDGEVNFPVPYALAPNVELSGSVSGAVIIAESRATGFKWKNGGEQPILSNGEVTWKSKGVRATEVPKPKPD
jgi:hypothetical protein